jgi:hypothetical protein
VTEDSGFLKGGTGLWQLRDGGIEPSRLFCPQPRLLRGNSSAVKFGKAQLPFVHRLAACRERRSARAKHPLCMDALRRRFVQRLAGGMIGHMIPDAHGKTYKTDFIEAG